MIKKIVGNKIIEMPGAFEHNGETIVLSLGSIKAVVDYDNDEEGNVLGFNLVYDISGGTVVNGIYVANGRTNVSDGPLYEQDSYEHPDYIPYDIRFLPPADFIEQVIIYEKDDDVDY